MLLRHMAAIFARAKKDHARHHSRLALGVVLLLTGATGCSRQPDTVPMTSAHWQTTGAEATFLRPRDAPQGVLQLNRGSAELKRMQFGNGTIEFDIGLVGHGITGIRFRQQDQNNADVFYLRPQANCASAYDCIQYMPLEHGAYEWDLFPQYETAAPVNSNGWNHIRLAIFGKRMQVFINGSGAPSLSVDDLEGPASVGSIALRGPASFRNFQVTPGKPLLSDAPQPAAANFVRDWRLSAPFPEPTVLDPGLNALVGATPEYTSLPPEAAPWREIAAEPQGLVDLSREVGSQKDGAASSLVWLKTTLDSDRDQSKRVRLGWVREVWVYNRGKLVFADRNLYGLPAASKPPDGRLSLENGSFVLQLHKGHNPIAIAIDDNLPDNAQHFGWGFAMRLDDPSGVSVAAH